MQAARTKLETALLVLAFAAFVATSLVVAVLLPRGRGNDEDGHMTYVRYVADFGRLPDPLAIDFGPNREPHQPPIYYLGGAAWLQGARAVGLSQDTVRLYSLVLGAAWFWLIWLTAKRLLPVGVRVLPNLALASMPMAAQLSGTVNNDIASILFATLMLYAAVRVWQGTSLGADGQVRRWYLIAALAGAGAILGKLFAGPAVVVIGIALTYRAFKTKQARAWLLSLAAAAAPVLLWLGTIYVQYGLFLPELRLDDHPQVAAYYDYWRAERLRPFLDVTWHTFIGRLGSWDIQLPYWFYVAQAWFWLIALVGLVWPAARRTLGVAAQSRRLVVLGLVAFAACWIPYLYLNIIFFQPQARYVYPGLVAVLLTAAIGWGALSKKLLPRARQAWLVPAGLLLVLNGAALVVTVGALTRG